MIEIAQRDFTYLDDSDATIETAARRRAPDARARAGAALRRAGDRRVLERRDSRAPHHRGSAGDLREAHEARRRDRVPRDQPLPRPGPRRRGTRARARPGRDRGSTTMARRRSRAAATGCCWRAIRRDLRRPGSPRSPSRFRPGPTGACGRTTSTTSCRCSNDGARSDEDPAHLPRAAASAGGAPRRGARPARAAARAGARPDRRRRCRGARHPPDVGARRAADRRRRRLRPRAGARPRRLGRRRSRARTPRWTARGPPR